MSSYADDINFVLSEVARFAKLTILELQELSFEDAIPTLPHPSGQGSLHCGARAEQRLRDLSELAISRSRFASRIEADPVVKELKKIIIDRFIKERRQLSDREAEKPLMGTAIVTGHGLPKNAPLARRFIDASAWYGEAVRDKFPASRMIKYMTAVERIVTTKNEEGLSETISRRGAALLTMGGIGNFQTDAKRIKVAYDKRSELIHGSTSPSEQKMGVALREAEFLSRKILLCSLLFLVREV